PTAVTVRSQPGALAYLHPVNSHQRMQAVPALGNESQQPTRMAGVALWNITSAPSPVIEHTIDLLPLLDRNDRRPIRLTDHLTLIHAQPGDRRTLDDLPDRGRRPATRVLRRRLHRSRHTRPIQTSHDLV